LGFVFFRPATVYASPISGLKCAATGNFSGVFWWHW